jgi:hypothetical protein
VSWRQKKVSNSNERNLTVFNGCEQKFFFCIQFHAKLVIFVRVYEVFFISISLLTEMHKMKKKKSHQSSIFLLQQLRQDSNPQPWNDEASGGTTVQLFLNITYNVDHRYLISDVLSVPCIYLTMSMALKHIVHGSAWQCLTVHGSA